MVLATFGGRFATYDASSVYGWVGGDMRFWPISAWKSLLALRAKGRISGRLQDTGMVHKPLRRRSGQTSMVFAMVLTTFGDLFAPHYALV